VDTQRLAREIQRDETAARKVLERLVEAGLVEARGVKKGRTYTLSPTVYQALGHPADYVRQVGFDVIQQEQMVLQFARNHGRITRKDAVALCRISEDQARRLLAKLYGENKLRRAGRGPATAYESN
jgi:ATP-dependent DNA helicase RecG